MDQLTPTISIPTSLQMLLRDLSFLSQITRGRKPCMKSRIMVDSGSWYGAFYRAYKGENRTIVMSEIERIFGQCIESIETHKNTEHIKIIIEFASGAYNGVDSLHPTYSDDPEMLSRLDVSLKNLDLQLSKYRQFIKGYSIEKKDDVKEEIKIDIIKEDIEDSSNSIDLFNSEENKRTKPKFRPKMNV